MSLVDEPGARADEPTADDRRGPRRLAALAVLVSLVLAGVQLLRAFPAIVAWELGADARLPVPLLVLAGTGPFVLVGTLPVVLRAVDARTCLLGAGVVLVGARVGAQLTSQGTRAGFVIVGVLAFLAFLTLALLARLPELAPAALGGVALDAAVRGATGTRDLLWVDDVWAAAAVTAVGLCIAVLLPTTRTITFTGRTHRHALPLVAAGPLLLLEILVLANQGWVAEVGEVNPNTAMATVVVGAACGAAAATLAGHRTTLPAWTVRSAAGAVVVATVIASLTQGWWLLPTVVVAQVAAGVALHRMAVSAGGGRALTAGIVTCTVGYVLLPVAGTAFYLQAFLHIPFPPAAAVIALGVLVGSGCLLAGASDSDALLPAASKTSGARRGAALVATAALLVAMVLVFDERPKVEPTGPSSARCRDFPIDLATFNVKIGVTMDGDLNLEEVADLLEEADPEIVALQEVSRGMLLSSGADMVAWLQDRLDLPYEVFHSPLGNPLYGTAVLSRLPIVDVRRRILPTTTEAGIARSLLSVVVDFPGDDLLVMNTHLASGSAAAARVAQVRAMVDVWDLRPQTVIAGDFNAARESQAISSLLEVTGFRVAGQVTPGADLTYKSVHPTQKLDWIFHPPDLVPVRVDSPRTLASDHLPVLTTLTRTEEAGMQLCR